MIKISKKVKLKVFVHSFICLFIYFFGLQIPFALNINGTKKGKKRQSERKQKNISVSIKTIWEKW